MGVLNYDSTSVEFDDRALAHLQIVIISKFRRNESLLLSWIDSQSTGGGRTSLWLTPSNSIRFHFPGSRQPAVDQAWLTRLQTSADSGAGLVVTDVHGQLLRGSRQLFKDR